MSYLEPPPFDLEILALGWTLTAITNFPFTSKITPVLASTRPRHITKPTIHQTIVQIVGIPTYACTYGPQLLNCFWVGVYRQNPFADFLKKTINSRKSDAQHSQISTNSNGWKNYPNADSRSPEGGLLLSVDFHTKPTNPKPTQKKRSHTFLALVLASSQDDPVHLFTKYLASTDSTSNWRQPQTYTTPNTATV